MLDWIARHTALVVAIAFLSVALVEAVRGLACAWSGVPLWAMAGLFLLGDDMTQYWWHRASHTPLLWPLHRAHHSAPHMGVRVVYRNNFFYYVMMPGLWISGALVFLG